MRLWPADASPDMLCAKLTANMSHQQWRDWVSPDIDYITPARTCPPQPMVEINPESFLLIHGTRKQRKAIKERQKAQEQAQKQSKGSN